MIILVGVVVVALVVQLVYRVRVGLLCLGARTYWYRLCGVRKEREDLSLAVRGEAGGLGCVRCVRVCRVCLFVVSCVRVVCVSCQKNQIYEYQSLFPFTGTGISVKTCDPVTA